MTKASAQPRRCSTTIAGSTASAMIWDSANIQYLWAQHASAGWAGQPSSFIIQALAEPADHDLRLGRRRRGKILLCSTT